MTRFYSNFCPANYFNNDVNVNFYNSLNNNIKKNFLLRLFPYTFTSEKKKFVHLLDESKFDSNNKLSSSKRIQKLRIFVTDHISTPFFEAIFSNVPVIVYCDYKNYGFNKKFSSILASGQKNNIIHLNPKNAANFINNNYENILDWWNGNEVKRFRIRIKKYLFKEKNNYAQNLIEDLSKFKN
jgi:putative transferase (TIGR04331 family)